MWALACKTLADAGTSGAAGYAGSNRSESGRVGGSLDLGNQLTYVIRGWMDRGVFGSVIIIATSFNFLLACCSMVFFSFRKVMICFVESFVSYPVSFPFLSPSLRKGLINTLDAGLCCALSSFNARASPKIWRARLPVPREMP